MATKTHLEGWNTGAQKITVPMIEGNGEAEIREAWQIHFVEVGTGNKILFTMNRETKDELVRQLTGGIVLYGGELPKV
jgi:hypothetical protein